MPTIGEFIDEAIKQGRQLTILGNGRKVLYDPNDHVVRIILPNWPEFFSLAPSVTDGYRRMLKLFPYNAVP